MSGPWYWATTVSVNTFFEELLSTAADSGAQEHLRGMRCASAEDARGLIVSMLRRSWGMAASHDLVIPAASRTSLARKCQDIFYLCRV
jgi:hypothetical protein